jgi:hypothetical protein
MHPWGNFVLKLWDNANKVGRIYAVSVLSIEVRNTLLGIAGWNCKLPSAKHFVNISHSADGSRHVVDVYNSVTVSVISETLCACARM